MAVQTEKTPQAVMLYLATLKAGAVFLPLNTAYTASEVEYFLTDAEPRVFVQDAVALAAEAAAHAPLATPVPEPTTTWPPSSTPAAPPAAPRAPC
uniref:AMP-binding protein n=1 Tax=Phenylobacterium glaciei TaxID=2803784 RepID=A0A974P485_9CAUL|nr:AMP-binding protein [Phenylobacterium glaciei]